MAFMTRPRDGFISQGMLDQLWQLYGNSVTFRQRVAEMGGEDPFWNYGTRTPNPDARMEALLPGEAQRRAFYSWQPEEQQRAAYRALGWSPNVPSGDEAARLARGTKWEYELLNPAAVGGQTGAATGYANWLARRLAMAGGADLQSGAGGDWRTNQADLYAQLRRAGTTGSQVSGRVSAYDPEQQLAMARSALQGRYSMGAQSVMDRQLADAYREWDAAVPRTGDQNLIGSFANFLQSRGWFDPLST